MLAPAHDVTVLHSASAALERLLAGEDYDVIFCDLLMPEMTGMDLFETLEQKAPRLTDRFVFLSGGAFTSHARTFRERVPNLFLDKPCTAAVLLAAVGDRAAAHRSADQQHAGELRGSLRWLGNRWSQRRNSAIHLDVVARTR